MKKIIKTAGKPEILKSKKTKKGVKKTTKKKAEVKTPVVATPVKAKVNPVTFDYPVGTKFVTNTKFYTVRDSFEESNTSMRLVYSEEGEQILWLTTIRDMAKEDPNFTIVE